MRWWAQAQDHSCRCFQPITTPTSLCVFLRAHLCGWGCFHGGSLRNHCAYGRGHAFKCTLCSMHHIWCWEAALMNHRSSEFLCVYHVCLYVFVHVSERATCKQIAWALMIQTSFPAHILFAWLILLCRTFLMHNVLAHWEGALEASPGPLTPSPKCLVGPFLPVHNPSAMQNSESNLLASFLIIPFVWGPSRVWVLDFGLWIGFGIFDLVFGLWSSEQMQRLPDNQLSVRAEQELVIYLYMLDLLPNRLWISSDFILSNSDTRFLQEHMPNWMQMFSLAFGWAT